jgi:hypothetical protein
MNRVVAMVDHRPQGEGPGRCTRRDDSYVKGLRNFILRYRSGETVARNVLKRENPGLYTAFSIHDHRGTDANVLSLIEARLLAKQSDEEIAVDVPTLPAAIHWYEALYFNVRDRLMAHDWIMNYVLMPSFRQSHEEATATADPLDEEMPGRPTFRPIAVPYYDSTLKFFAYFGGRVMLDFVISGFKRGVMCQTQESIGDWFDNHYIHKLKHKASMGIQNMEVNRYNVMQLFEVNNQIISIQRSDESADKQQDSITKAIGGLMRDMRDMWQVGDEGAKLVEDTDLAAFDEGASELRDAEAILVARGEKLGTIDLPAKLPPPRPKPLANGQEDPVHANAKQGS